MSIILSDNREDLVHGRNRRLDFDGILDRLGSDPEKIGLDVAFAQLGDEQAQHSLYDKMEEARQDISRLHGETSVLQTWAEIQHRGHKYSLAKLEKKGFPHRKKPRTGSTA